MTRRTRETLDSLIDFSWVCMWHGCCQCETRQHFIFHRRRVWSAPLTLDAKRLAMSSGDKRAQPPHTPLGCFNHSLRHRLLSPRASSSSVFQNKDDLCKGCGRCFVREGGRSRWKLWPGYLSLAPVWARRERQPRGGTASEDWHLTWTGAGQGRQGRSQGPPGSVCGCVYVTSVSEAEPGRGTVARLAWGRRTVGDIESEIFLHTWGTSCTVHGLESLASLSATVCVCVKR